MKRSYRDSFDGESTGYVVEDDLGGCAHVSYAQARALLHALAAHLQVELPPDGWRATEYRPREDEDALEAEGWYLGEVEDGWGWSAFRPIAGGGGGEEEVGPYETAAEAAAAVEALAEEQRSGEAE